MPCLFMSGLEGFSVLKGLTTTSFSPLTFLCTISSWSNSEQDCINAGSHPENAYVGLDACAERYS